MSLTDLKERVVAKATAYRLALTMLMLSGLVGMASAVSINESIQPIIMEMVKLFVPLLAVVLGSLPIIISLAIIGFILGLLGMILMKLK